jgi:hypothetical protein
VSLVTALFSAIKLWTCVIKWHENHCVFGALQHYFSAASRLVKVEVLNAPDVPLFVLGN